MDLPRLSVVTGTYNRFDMLRRMIDSVRAQRFEGVLELVVVDGGSTDGSREWLVEQSDVVAVLEHNRDAAGRMRFGWPICYNRGFGAAASELICMLNDDLVLEEDCLELGVQVLENDPVAGGVAFFFRDSGDPLGYRVGHAYGGRLFINYGIYRRDLWQSLGGFDGRRFRFYHADTDLSLKCWEAGRPLRAEPRCRLRHFPEYGDDRRLDNYRTSEQAGDWRRYVSRWERLKRSPEDAGYWQYLGGEVRI